MMDPREALNSAFDSLRAHALRSFLTVLGIIFGVGAVIAMLSIGAGAERQSLAMIDTMGVRNILVRAKEFKEDEQRKIREKSLGLSRRDADALLEAVPGIDNVAQKSAIQAYKVISPEGRARPEVLGVSASYGEMMNLALEEGRFLDPFDEEAFAQVCVIGSRLRRDLFGFGPAIGRVVKVNEEWLTVVGVLAAPAVGGAGTEFQGVAIASTVNDLYLPITTANRKFRADPLKSPADELIVRMKPGARVQEAAAVVGSLVDRLHGGANDTTIVVPEALLEESERTQRLFNVVMGCIAGISLLVGGIGIMNIMLATVLERTREIGVRRAMGARRTDIRNQFIIESFTISVCGGLVGVVMGVAIAKGVAAYAGWQTIVTPGSILLSTGVSLAVGLVFGIYPAIRAAGLDPIDALRYE
jgi:putative ABC transport system permease protein